MQELVRKLVEQLEQNAHTKTFNIKVEGVNGSENFILLRGTCRSFYQKQCAQEVIKGLIPEGVRLRNEIDVLYSTNGSGYDGEDDDLAQRKPR